MYKKIIEEHKPKFEKAIEHFISEIAALRTGRANPALVEGILVESYGAKTPLKNIASISTPDSRSILIQPWDKNTLKDIEKAIAASPLGIQPVNDGNHIRLNLPQLSEERRKELVKLVKQHAESARVSIRNVREEIWKEIGRIHKEKQITDDQKFEAQEELKKVVDEYNARVKELLDKKEQEIMTV